MPSILRWALIPAAAALVLMAAPRAFSQGTQYLTQKVQVQTQVTDDNLEDAKRRAMDTAKTQALQQALEQLVHAEWRGSFADALKEKIYSHLSSYLSSYQLEEDPGADKKTYRMTMTAQINRTRLEHDLHEIPLPLLTDPVRRIPVFYRPDDPLLSQPDAPSQVTARLNQRLALLNIALAVPTPADSTAARALGSNPRENFEARQDALTRVGGGAVEVAWLECTGQGSSMRMRLVIYQTTTGFPLGLFDQDPAKPVEGQGAELLKNALEYLAVPLTAQIQPGRILESATGEFQRNSQWTTLAVTGLNTPFDQDTFEKSFFTSPQGKPFAAFGIYSLSAQGVTYWGKAQGNLDALVTGVRGKRVGNFLVENAVKENHLVRLTVRRAFDEPPPALKAFPENAWPRVLKALMENSEEGETARPRLTETEDNGYFDRANPLQLNRTIYGQLSARRDSDFFRTDSGGPNLTIRFTRLDQTALNPEIRVYDQDRNLLQAEPPGKSAEVRVRLPAGTQTAWVEVGDQFGYVPGETGGYRLMHYLLWVGRN
ncbi:MAG: hypothetical protein OEV94_00550 [Deltaproteobacteria bacterium]|nr:hypothetical protein [Deltaproteobacteria bacterium]